jgi:hypothetical protein
VYFLRHFLKFRQNNQKIPFLQTPKNKIFEKQPKNSLSTNSKKQNFRQNNQKIPFLQFQKRKLQKITDHSFFHKPLLTDSNKKSLKSTKICFQPVFTNWTKNSLSAKNAFNSEISRSFLRFPVTHVCLLMLFWLAVSWVAFFAFVLCFLVLFWVGIWILFAFCCLC